MKMNYDEQLKLIIESDVFRRMKYQRHHYNITLLYHVISVAKVCRNISSFLRKAGISVHEDELLIAAFCHDLGMVDRYDKDIYPKHRDLALGHGNRSCHYARKILKDNFTKREEHIIKRHMFPMKAAPLCREGWILIAADKFCTAWDFLWNIRRSGVY